jgi:hypothetical protein
MAEPASTEELERLYGPWRSVGVSGAAELLQGFGEPWWVAGGYAIEAFTGVRRDHADTDVGIFKRDLASLRKYFRDTHHLWAAGSRALKPLTADEP